MAVWSEVDRASVSDANRLDPEFFRIDYLLALEKLQKLGCKKLRSFGVGVVSGPFGSTLKSHSYLAEGIPFIRILDLKNFFVSNEQLIFISEEDNNKIRGSQLKTGDLVISKVGNSIGLVSILDEDYPIANISENNIGIKFGPAHNEGFKFFILTYLNSFFGQNEILRRRSGNAQPKLNVADIYNISVPEISPAFQEDIKNIVTDAKLKIKLSKELYLKASKTLEKELGLDQLVLEKPKSYETSFSEVVSGGRIDSDYFQVHFKQQANHLSMIQSKPLRELVDFQKGIEVGSPAYTSSGKLFVRVSNVKKTGVVTGNSDKYISETLFKCLESYQPKIGDILLTKDGTVGVCYVVDETVDGIISGGIMKLSKKDESIPSEYLALVINSPICQFQIDRDCSGALIVHWKPKDIAALKIPILTEDKMAELSDLVNQSKIAKKESEQLLDQAKRMVEELIEGAI